MTDESLLLHGVMSSRSGDALTCLRCSSQVAIVGDLVAIASQVDPERLQTLSGAISLALDHDELLRGISRQSDIAPARFGASFGTRFDLVNSVKSNSDAWRGALARIAGTEEFTVRITGGPRPSQLSEGGSEASSGGGYLRARLMQNAAKSTAQASLARFVYDATDALSQAALQARLSQTRSRAAARSPLIAEIAVLARRGAARSIDRCCQGLSRRAEGLGLDATLLGPLPPYSFVAG